LLKLQQQAAQARKERDEKSVALQAIVTKVATKLKISVEKMRDMVVDDQTGAVTEVPVKSLPKSAQPSQ